MQRVGRALSVTPSKGIIVKTEDPPKIGCEIADENLAVIGKVFDIIGPVASPYIVIKSNVKNPITLLNKPLYLLLSKSRGKK